MVPCPLGLCDGHVWAALWALHYERTHDVDVTSLHARARRQVEPNDAMAVLAERFGTSIKHVRMNNWDLAQVGRLSLSPLSASPRWQCPVARTLRRA